nr:MAG TPA: hypothetical protein [Caudoviricetes sp.]
MGKYLVPPPFPRKMCLKTRFDKAQLNSLLLIFPRFFLGKIRFAKFRRGERESSSNNC